MSRGTTGRRSPRGCRCSRFGRTKSSPSRGYRFGLARRTPPRPTSQGTSQSFLTTTSSLLSSTIRPSGLESRLGVYTRGREERREVGVLRSGPVPQGRSEWTGWSMCICAGQRNKTPGSLYPRRCSFCSQQGRDRHRLPVSSDGFILG